MENKNMKTMTAKNLQQVSAASRIMGILVKFGTYLFLGVMALIVLFPFYWMIISSLKTEMEYKMPVPTFFPREIRLPPAPAQAVSIGWSGGLAAVEKARISSSPCPCHAQSLSKKFPAGVSYHKAPLRFGSRSAGSGSAVLPQSKSALSFSSCPASGQTKSSQNMAHAV